MRLGAGCNRATSGSAVTSGSAMRPAGSAVSRTAATSPAAASRLQVDQGVERRPAQLLRDVRRRTHPVHALQYAAPVRRYGGVGGAAGAHERGSVGHRLRPDPVQQFPAPERLALHGVHGNGADRADPVGDPVAEAGRGPGRGEGEERGVVQRPQVAQLQGAARHPAAVHEVAAHPLPGTGLGDRVPPALAAQRAATGEQDVDAGGGGALGVHHLAVGQVEGAAVAHQGAGGPFGGEALEHGREDGGRGGGARGAGG